MSLSAKYGSVEGYGSGIVTEAIVSFLIAEVPIILASLVLVVFTRFFCENVIFGVKWLLETKKAALLVIEDHNTKKPVTPD